MNRRRFLLSALAAPVIVRASSLMAVVPVPKITGLTDPAAWFLVDPELNVRSLMQVMIEIRETAFSAGPLFVRPTKLIVHPDWLDDGVRLLAAAHPEPDAAPA